VIEDSVVETRQPEDEIAIDEDDDTHKLLTEDVKLVNYLESL